MDTWNFYREKIKDGALDAFYQDAMEFRESAFYVYDFLNRNSPANGASHDWNAARSAMSMVIDDYDKAFFRFMDSKTEENAGLFSEQMGRMNKPLTMAMNAIFQSDCKRNWGKNKFKYDKWHEERRSEPFEKDKGK